MEKKNDSRYDVLKLVLSLFVVAIHSDLFPPLLYPWLRVAVPLFFMMSSYFLFDKLCKTKEDKARGAVLCRYALRNLKLYLFWFILLLPVTLFVRKEVYFSAGVLKGAYAFLTGLFFGSTFVASWYIMASVLGTLIVYYLSLRLGNKALLAIFIPVYMLIAVRDSYFSLFDGHAVVRDVAKAVETVFGDPAQSVLIAPFWITLGKCFAEDTFCPSRKTCAAFIPVGGVLLYAEWLLVRWLDLALDNTCYFALPLFCVFVFGFLQGGKEWESPYGVELRRCSTVIYALHGSALVLIKGVYRRVFAIDIPALFFLTAVVSCVVVYLLVRTVVRRGGRISTIIKYAY